MMASRLREKTTRPIKYYPTGDPPVAPGIVLGTKADRDRETSFTFRFETGEVRSFAGATHEEAESRAQVWGLLNGPVKLRGA